MSQQPITAVGDFSGRKGVMIVNTLIILGFHTVPGEFPEAGNGKNYVAHKIFHELGIVIPVLGYILFVIALQERIHRAGSAFLNKRDQIFHPEERPELNLDPDYASLVMGPIRADSARAGTEIGRAHV